MSDWLPWIRSPDAEINQFRDRMVSRSRDLRRNDGWAAGAITRILDSTIGGAYRLSSMPDYRSLSRFSRAFDAKWAEDYRLFVESEWRAYAEDLGHYNDVARELTITQQLRLALDHMLVDGDGLVVTHWKPERIGRGAAKYATCFQVVDPDRLSNPMQMVDTKHLRGGVEIDDDGVPFAYHIRKQHQNDWYNTVESMEWERVLREDDDGFRRVTHHFERNRAGQHRGIGVFVPVLSRMKMLARYYGVELQAATIASVFGTYVTSPYDPAMVEDALNPQGEEGFSWYQGMRQQFHEQRKPMLNNAVIPTLAPGEKLETVSAERPNSGFGDFTRQMLLGIATSLGISYEQLTSDYSGTNYSSARAAIAETERSVKRRLAEFNSGIANPLYASWLSEVFENGKVPLPRNAPNFFDVETAYARCSWRGPGAGLVDGVKERQASVLGMDGALTTLQDEIAETSGRDYREILEQRAIEIAECKRLGIPPPTWMGLDTQQTEIKQATPTPPDAE
jgi:lambda family phage portal protein